LASLRLRDRDAITTKEGLIFRVYGYTHPLDGFVCDLEYAPAEFSNLKIQKPLEPTGKISSTSFMKMKAGVLLKRTFPNTWLLTNP